MTTSPGSAFPGPLRGSDTPALSGRGRRATSRAAAATGLVLVVFAASACGSAAGPVAGSPAAATSTSGNPPSTSESGPAGSVSGSSGGQGGGQGGAAFAGRAGAPGASGIIAAVQQSTFEVQSTTSQTTVSFTPDTVIQQTVAGSLADVTVGSCITAVALPAAAGSGTAPSTESSGAGGQQPSGFAQPAAITASTVTIEPSVNGSCAAGGFGRGSGGGFPGGAGAQAGQGQGQGQRTFSGQTRPTGATGTGGDDGGSRGGSGSRFGAGGFGVVSGQVASVSGSTIAVTVTAFPGGLGRSGGSTANAPAQTAASSPTAGSSTSTVTVTSATTFTTTAVADASAIVVGQCASAVGPADDTGAIAATQIRLSQPVDGACTAGFGGFPRGGQNRGASGGSGSAPESTHG